MRSRIFLKNEVKSYQLCAEPDENHVCFVAVSYKVVIDTIVLYLKNRNSFV